MFKSPHGLTVDKFDNIWVTNTQTNKIYKFDRNKRLVLTIEKGYGFFQETAFRIRNILSRFPVTRDVYIFAKPTDIASTTKGEIVVTPTVIETSAL